MLTDQHIQEARLRIGAALVETPCPHSEPLSKRCGADVYLKLENLQMTGSFKERGACNKLLSLTAEERARGVITASAGNHGQALAYHAARLGIVATVVMPETTPLIKAQSTRSHGAEVVLFGSNYDEAAEHAAMLCARQSRVYVHPFDDLSVIAGQGTLALEILEQVPAVEAIVVPIGGGGLAAGMTVALRSSHPRVHLYGVETTTLPSMQRAIEDGHPTTLPSGKTIADGIAVKTVGKLPLSLLQHAIDGIALVDEEEIAEAILVLLEREKTVAEGAGAVGVAALLGRKLPVLGKRVVVVLSGGNIDVNVISRIIERGLVKSGRTIRLRVILPDVSGVLSQVTQEVAQTRANILEIRHDRAFSGVLLGETVVELVLETRGFDHIDELRKRLSGKGYRLLA